MNITKRFVSLLRPEYSYDKYIVNVCDHFGCGENPYFLIRYGSPNGAGIGQSSHYFYLGGNDYKTFVKCSFSNIVIFRKNRYTNEHF